MPDRATGCALSTLDARRSTLDPVVTRARHRPPLSRRPRRAPALGVAPASQSLHTTVAHPSGLVLEVQIRTDEMHAFAEGSHTTYKSRGVRPALLPAGSPPLTKLLLPAAAASSSPPAPPTPTPGGAPAARPQIARLRSAAATEDVPQSTSEGEAAE